MDSTARKFMERQRRAREERDALLAAAAADLGQHEGSKQRRSGGSAQDFWDLVDTSPGVDECHPWLGRKDWNHETEGKRYQRGVFELVDVCTHIVSRLVVLLTYGKELDRLTDVTPICGDHTCCNVRHYAITPHGGTGKTRDRKSVPVEEYFCRDL